MTIWTLPSTTDLRTITSRAEWLQWRREVLTGTDVAAVAGVHEYRTPLAVYVDKVRGSAIDLENEIMRRGRWLEPALLGALREERPDWTIRPARVFMRDHSRRLGGTPDMVAIRPDIDGIGIVEGKVVAERVFVATWEDGPPLRHQLQALTYGFLAGASWASVAALVVGEFTADLAIFDVPLVAAAWDRITREAEAFWQSIARGDVPNIRPDMDNDVVRALYPVPRLPAVDLSADNALPILLDERAVLTKAIGEAEKRKEEINTIVMAAMGEASEGSLPGWRILWKTETKPEHVRQAWSGRVLRVYPKKGMSK